jgi:hypothetical protein
MYRLVCIYESQNLRLFKTLYTVEMCHKSAIERGMLSAYGISVLIFSYCFRVSCSPCPCTCKHKCPAATELQNGKKSEDNRLGSFIKIFKPSARSSDETSLNDCALHRAEVRATPGSNGCSVVEIFADAANECALCNHERSPAETTLHQ